jgi:hypothetical protein
MTSEVLRGGGERGTYALLCDRECCLDAKSRARSHDLIMIGASSVDIRLKTKVTLGTTVTWRGH